MYKKSPASAILRQTSYWIGVPASIVVIAGIVLLLKYVLVDLLIWDLLFAYAIKPAWNFFLTHQAFKITIAALVLGYLVFFLLMCVKECRRIGPGPTFLILFQSFLSGCAFGFRVVKFCFDHIIMLVELIKRTRQRSTFAQFVGDIQEDAREVTK